MNERITRFPLTSGKDASETGVSAAARQTRTPSPPPATRVPLLLERHGHTRIDEYHWLRDRDNPEVSAYLEAENAYLQATLAHTEELQSTLYEEIVARIPQRDSSVPTFENGYFYYTRFEEGQDYPIHARRKGSLDADEEVILDVNELAKGQSYFHVEQVTVSANGDIAAFTADNVGRRNYTLRFRDLVTGEMLADEIPLVTEHVAWANDNRTIFYNRRDPETLRSWQTFRHELGTDPTSDPLVYQEDDETFDTFVYRTKSKRYLIIGSHQTVTSEYRILEADTPHGAFRLFAPRQRGHEYAIDHLEDHFYIRTNDNAKNFRLMKTPADATAREHWTEIIPHREDVYLGDIELFRHHLVVTERRNALIALRVIPWTGDGEHYVTFDEPAYVAAIGENPNTETTKLRFVYSSLTTPWSTFEHDMIDRSRTLLKRTDVGGGFDASHYVTERLFAPATDGARIPISIAYHRDFRRDGSAPLVLYGYGSYGHSIDPAFNPAVISLLDRGFVYAIAHIRGGQELGREWYENGKLLRKKNTFTDFVDAAEFLATTGYAARDNMFAWGGSAGGLLVGAVINMRPDLFRGAVASVPFVDIVTTMLDATIPLTTFEYDEWGNPEEKEFYEYMLSYSPYDGVKAQSYPHLLVMTGLHDSQVQYWEPAKWVAKLRAMKTGDELVLMHTNMEAGHGGASGRFRKQKETALIYAFIIDIADRAGEV